MSENIIFLRKVEQKKLHRRKTLLLLAAMLSVELIWIWESFHDVSGRWDNMEYYGMIYLIPQLIVIFFPLTFGIVASRLCDMEHRGSNFKLLCTVEKKSSIYEIKVLKGLEYCLILTLSQIIIILFMGKIYHYKQSIPVDNLVFLVLEIFVVSICTFLLQLLLSLFVENQLIPLVIGLVGSFSGLFTMYVPMLRPFTIWGYYVLLSPVGFWWDSETRDYGAVDAPCQWGKLFVFVILAVLMYEGGKIAFEKKEA